MVGPSQSTLLHDYFYKYHFDNDQIEVIPPKKIGGNMVRFEDVDGLKYTIRPEDIESFEQIEKDGNFLLNRKGNLKSIEIDETTYNNLTSYLAKEYDDYWAEKMNIFNDMLDEDEPDDNAYRDALTGLGGTISSGSSGPCLGSDTWTYTSGTQMQNVYGSNTLNGANGIANAHSYQQAIQRAQRAVNERRLAAQQQVQTKQVSKKALLDKFKSFMPQKKKSNALEQLAGEK